MLWGILGANLLRNLLSGKGIAGTSYGNKKGKGIVTTGYGNKMDFLMLPHPLTNFEIQKYYHQNESRFNGAYSRNNLPNKIKNGVCIINLDQYADVSAH